MDIHVLWISVFSYPCFYGYPFGYPWISIDIHVLTCYGFSIQGNEGSLGKVGNQNTQMCARLPIHFQLFEFRLGVRYCSAGLGDQQPRRGQVSPKKLRMQSFGGKESCGAPI